MTHYSEPADRPMDCCPLCQCTPPCAEGCPNKWQLPTDEAATDTGEQLRIRSDIE